MYEYRNDQEEWAISVVKDQEEYFLVEEQRPQGIESYLTYGRIVLFPLLLVFMVIIVQGLD